MDELVQWLRAQLDTDALWATEASRPHGQAAHEGGVHWQWVEPETDTPVTADPSHAEYLTDEAGNFRFSLRSVEKFPREHVRPLPLFALHSVEEIPVAVAGHIVEWDPARVLREIDSKRRMLDECVRAVDHDSRGMMSMAEDFLRLLALPYADRPGYKEEWRP